MARWERLTPADARRQPWRNGRGETLELALWPPGAGGAFEWRVSKAGVDAPGPFSAFPGCVRVLVVVEGPGLLLDHGAAGGRHLLRPLEAYAFDGDWPTTAEPCGGPVRDIGVIARKGRWRPEVETLRLGTRRARYELGPDEHGFLHVLRGAIGVRLGDEEEPLSLPAEHSLHVDAGARGADLEALGATADAQALFVRLAPEGSP